MEELKINLEKWGFDGYFRGLSLKESDKSLIPARVIGHNRHFYDVVCEKGFFSAKTSGSIRYNSVLKSDLPAVGDWVMISLRRDKSYICSILPRKNCISRRCSGNIIDEQVLSANIDIVFIVMSLDENFNLKRLQRYISLVASSRIKSVILLTKSDLCERRDELLDEVKKNAPEKEIFAISSFDESTEKLLKSFIKPGISAVFIGSSGVGKSTLINTLSGSHIRVTGEISSAVHKGRHTTSARELILLASGGMVIDTPGMREIQNWQEEDASGFEMILELSQQCRFADCRHRTEPGCAVKEAVENGILSAETVEMWLKQLEESEELKQKKAASLKILETRRSKRKKNKGQNID